MSNSPDLWDEIRNPNCRDCPLWEDAGVVCVMGNGPKNAKVMVVGEAPGFSEQQSGLPFQGQAGQYLNRIFREAGLKREDLYVTNAVKCRPPDNRTPTKTEIKRCRQYLARELEVIQPELVVLLGNTALQSGLGVTGITKRRGSAEKVGDVTYFSTYHPAAILRNPALEGEFVADSHAIARLARGDASSPKTKVTLIRSEQALAKLCHTLDGIDSAISFDVETRGRDGRKDAGLQPWAPDGVIDVLGLCWEPGHSHVVAIDHPDARWQTSTESVYQALDVALQNKKLVGHNAKFDLEWLKAKGLDLKATFDTFVAAHLLDENRSNSLKSLARTYLGAGHYEGSVDFKSGEVQDLKTLAIYNGRDVDYTLQLYPILKKEILKSNKMTRLFKFIMMPAVNAFPDIELVGFPVDMERLETRHKEILWKINDIEQELCKFVPEEMRPQGRPNFRSPIFLGNWLFGHLELPIIEVGAKSGRPSTNESVLLQLRKMHPAVDMLMELRKWSKYESTYTRNWLARTEVAAKPRLYTSYNLGGTVTGRLSSNMQQVPRDTFIRGIIGVPARRKLIEADFSQIELRIAAMLSRDSALTRVFREGGDPHLETAIAVSGLPKEKIDKEKRKMAKAVNFGFLYGMGWRKFIVYADEKYGVKLSEVEAQRFRDAFFDKYSALLPWHARQRRLVEEKGYVASPLGRVRHLPGVNSSDEALVAEAYRQAINSPVQGFASDLAVLSMSILHERLNPKRAKVLGNLHDAVILEVLESEAEATGEVVREVMENLPLKRLFGYVPSVPIKVDIGIVDHWGGD